MIAPVNDAIDWQLWEANAARMDREMWRPCRCPLGTCPSETIYSAAGEPIGLRGLQAYSPWVLYMGHHRHSAFVKLDDMGRITFVHGKEPRTTVAAP